VRRSWVSVCQRAPNSRRATSPLRHLQVLILLWCLPARSAGSTRPPQGTPSSTEHPKPSTPSNTLVKVSILLLDSPDLRSPFFALAHPHVLAAPPSFPLTPSSHGCEGVSGKHGGASGTASKVRWGRAQARGLPDNGRLFPPRLPPPKWPGNTPDPGAYSRAYLRANWRAISGRPAIDCGLQRRLAPRLRTASAPMQSEIEPGRRA